MTEENRKKEGSLWGLMKKIHSDEEGAVSLETILIIAAVAIPILIFIIKFGWPRVRDYFDTQMDNLETSTDDSINSGGY